MLVEDFEDLAHVAPETVTLEFVNGLLEVKPGRDGNHSEVVMCLFRECTRQRTDLVLYPVTGLAVARTESARTACSLRKSTSSAKESGLVPMVC